MEVDGGGGGMAPRPGPKRSYFRAGARPQQVCTFWLEGRCNRVPCNFRHSTDDSSSMDNMNVNSGGGGGAGFSSGPGKRSNSSTFDHEHERDAPSQRRNVWGRIRGNVSTTTTAAATTTATTATTAPSSRSRTIPCTYFLRGKCLKGDQCNFLHSFSSSEDMSFLTQLVGHEKAVRAIALPDGANMLYTGAQDSTIRIWDCETGQCSTTVSVGGDVGCLLAESGWLFIGVPNEVKALNLQTNSEQRLEGPKGQVHALAVFNDMLLAGTHDGNILAWKFNVVANMFQPAATLWGHAGGVLTLEVADGRLYSGSMDNTIKVWDLNTGHCIHTLQAHTNVVMGLLCWNQYLISGSLDGTVKVWAPNQSGTFEVHFTYPKDSGTTENMDGVLAFCGFVDSQNKHILLCSLNDNTVRVLELPSFTERGILYSKDEVRALHVGPGGLIFSGDNAGGVKVWKWAP